MTTTIATTSTPAAPSRVETAPLFGGTMALVALTAPTIYLLARRPRSLSAPPGWVMALLAFAGVVTPVIVLVIATAGLLRRAGFALP